MNLVKFSCLIGVGNPTNKFNNTRHNLGKMFVSWLIEKHSAPLIKKELYSYALIKLSSESQIACIVPETYMNESGKIIPYLKNFYTLPTDIIVVHDDLEMPLGASKLRIDKDRGLRGHNGLRSIDSFLKGKPYFLSLGIGRPEVKSVSDYVLESFSLIEQKKFENLFIEAEKLLI